MPHCQQTHGDHLQHLERTLRELLPLDFPEDVPVYIVSEWDAGREFSRIDANGTGSCCFGWTSWNLDVRLRSHLQQWGRWRGRGFATIINESLNRTSTELLITALHEAAHYFDFQAAGFLEDSADDIEASLQRRPFSPRLRELVEQQLRILGASPPVPRWDGHGPPFLRAALHLRARAIANGFDPDWLNCENLDLADPLAYWLSLCDEAETRVDEPLCDVLADPPPVTFTAFAERDLQHKNQLWADVGPDVARLLRGEPVTNATAVANYIRQIRTVPPPDFPGNRQSTNSLLELHS